MESTQHAQSLFITLTYSEEHIPEHGSLKPRDVQLFLKKLRARLTVLGLPGVRFYAVGEYGDKTWRPHYHVALFGLSVPVVLGKHVPPCSCLLCVSWSFGLVHVGRIMVESAAYVAAYTVKKMTQVTDPRLAGRHPEFSRMSRKPGIGAGAMAAFKEALIDKTTGEIRLREYDVPSVARSLGKLWPLGRYLRQRLRKEVFGTVDEPSGLAEVRGRKLQAEMLVDGTLAALERQQQGRDSRARRAEGLERINRQKKGVGL